MKVFIHPSASGKAREELEAIVEEAGCEVVDGLDEIDCKDDEEQVDEEGAGEPEAQLPEEDGDADEPAEQPPVCIVVLEDGRTEAELEPVLTQAVGRGCKVIGVWAPGATGDVSPLKDYGADTVSWDGSKIRDAICGVPQHLGPGGEGAERPKSTHGGCAK